MRVLLILVAVLLVAGSVAASVRIQEVHPRARAGWATEHVRLASDAPTTLDGWYLSDGEGRVPLAGQLAAGEALVVAENASQLRRWTALPDRVVPSDGTGFKLANGGDQIRLVTPRGGVQDSVHYGSVPAGRGWWGPAVPAPGAGEVLVRQGQDTDTQEDFAARRVVKLGQTRLRTGWTRGNVTLFAAPDSAHRQVLRVLDGARSRIDLNLYELTHPDVLDRLESAIDRGVAVRVLLEGGPVGWNFTMPRPDPHLESDRWAIWRAANRQTWIASRLRQAGADVHVLGNARYRFDHAKYAVVDDAVVVTTENWGRTGLPRDPSWGNRGFGVVVGDADVAGTLRHVFGQDADVDRPDVRPHRLEPHPSFRTGTRTPSGAYRPRHEPVVVPDARVRVLVAPDESWDLLDVVAGATDQVRVWALDLNVAGPAGRPFREALVAAAEGGADVDVLVNDNAVYDADQVDRVARTLAPHGIDVAGLSAGDPFVNLHAKAIVADDTVYVGSANFNAAAFTVNREVGVLVESPAAAAWMIDVFTGDRELARVADAPTRTGPPTTWGLVAVAVGGSLALGLRGLRRT